MDQHRRRGALHLLSVHSRDQCQFLTRSNLVGSDHPGPEAAGVPEVLARRPLVGLEYPARTSPEKSSPHRTEQLSDELEDPLQGPLPSANTTPEPEGGHRSRVAVMALDGGRTRCQRFLDFGVFETEESAEAHSIAAGKEWIDAQVKQEALATLATLPPPQKRPLSS